MTWTFEEAEARLSRYFPSDLLAGLRMRGGLSIMAGVLEQLGEEPLRPGGRQLRVLCVPSFESAMCVRVCESEGGARLTARPGDEPRSEPSVTSEASLSGPDWDALLESVDTAGLWEMPATLDRMGLDGEFWLIEIRSDERYHMIHRWSPDIPGPEAGLLRFGVGVLTLGGFGDRVRGWLVEER